MIGGIESLLTLQTTQLSQHTMTNDHNCSWYKGCNKSKARCTEHYWSCYGTGGTHDFQKVMKGKACDSDIRRAGKLETCGNKEGSGSVHLFNWLHWYTGLNHRQVITTPHFYEPRRQTTSRFIFSLFYLSRSPFFRWIVRLTVDYYFHFCTWFALFDILHFWVW